MLETDEESTLGMSDYGVRKYDSFTSRFMTADVLFEKYPAWNPYHYSVNNPITYRDGNGYATFYANDGTEIYNDGNDDGLKFLSSKEIMESSIGEGGEINPLYMQRGSFLLPDKQAWFGENGISETIVQKIGPYNNKENAGAYGLTLEGKMNYSYGGESVTMPNGYTENSGPAIAKAKSNLIKSNSETLMTYIHSHFAGSNQTPSIPGDYNAVRNGGFHSGVMINTQKQAFFYKTNQSSQIQIGLDDLIKIIKE